MPIPIKGTGGSVISSLRSDLSCKSFLFGHLPYRIPPYKGTPSAAKRSFDAADAPLARRLRMTDRRRPGVLRNERGVFRADPSLRQALRCPQAQDDRSGVRGSQDR